MFLLIIYISHDLVKDFQALLLRICSKKFSVSKPFISLRSALRTSHLFISVLIIAKHCDIFSIFYMFVSLTLYEGVRVMQSVQCRG